MSKVLVSYLSFSGVTAKVAEKLAAAANADLCEIQVEVPYTAEDLDYTNPKSRCSVEMTDAASRPAIKDVTVDVASYDVIYVGFPIWWGVAPHAVHTFLEKFNLAGKKVIVFATSAQSGMGETVAKLADSAKDACLVEGCIAKTDEDIAGLVELAK